MLEPQLRPSNQARLDNLLTLRVLATFAVVFGHAASFFGAFSWSQFPASPYIQSQAVTVFFLVSGYTIAWVCDRDAKRGGGISRFLFDRAVRLVVPLVPILLLIAVAEYFIFEQHPYGQNFDSRTLIGNVFFLQNISFGIPGSDPILAPGIGVFGTNRPLWTISLEFWVYVAFAGSFFAFTARRRVVGITSIAIGFAGWLALNEAILAGSGAGLPLVWLLGALIYWALKRVPLAQPRDFVIAAPLFGLIGTMLAAVQYWPIDGANSPTYNMIVALAFFLFIGFCPILPVRWTRVMRWMGSFAYTTYLAHYPIQYSLWYYSLLPRNEFGALLAIIASMFASYLLGLMFEKHYKDIRDKVLISGVILTKLMVRS